MQTAIIHAVIYLCWIQTLETMTQVDRAVAKMLVLVVVGYEQSEEKNVFWRPIFVQTNLCI